MAQRGSSAFGCFWGHCGRISAPRDGRVCTGLSDAGLRPTSVNERNRGWGGGRLSGLYGDLPRAPGVSLAEVLPLAMR